MNKLIEHLSEKNLFTSRLAFGRSLLALSCLGTLLFTDIEGAMNIDILDVGKGVMLSDLVFKEFSVFEIMNIKLAKLISILILLISIIGYFPQITILFQTWVHISLCNSVLEIDGGDQIAANLSLILIPICIFDSRKNHWQKVPTNKRPLTNLFTNIIFILILLQVSVVYFHAGAGKLNVEEWLNGTCLYFWTTNNVFGAPEFLQPILNFFTLSRMAPLFTWLVIFLELGLFACILATNHKIKLVFLILGVAFHFAIFVTHGLASFFFSTSGALILYLDSKDIFSNYILNLFQSIFQKLIPK
jgi:antimicrobial peptide system SdpB family protein